MSIVLSTDIPPIQSSITLISSQPVTLSLIGSTPDITSTLGLVSALGTNSIQSESSLAGITSEKVSKVATISQATTTDNVIFATNSISANSNPIATNAPISQGSNGLSLLIILSIVTGILATLVVSALIGVFYYRNSRRKNIRNITDRLEQELDNLKRKTASEISVLKNQVVAQPSTQSLLDNSSSSTSLMAKTPMSYGSLSILRCPECFKMDCPGILLNLGGAGGKCNNVGQMYKIGKSNVPGTYTPTPNVF